MTKVLHVVPSYYPAHVYGGPIQSVHYLCLALAKQGTEVHVLTTDANGDGRLAESGQTIEFVPGLTVIYCPKTFNPDISFSLLRQLPSQIKWADLVHLNAVYSFTTIPTLAWAALLQKPVVWSPRGAMNRWEGSTKPFTKKLWDLACRVVATGRTVVHATSDREREASASRFPKLHACVVANGVQIPPAVQREPIGECFRLVFLGRVHPIKGIENLLDACAMLMNRRRNFTVKVAGQGDTEYVAGLEQKTRDLNLQDRVQFIGRVDEAARTQLLNRSDLLVLPSFSENFGLVVAEALAHSVPVVASKDTPWQKLEEMGCGVWSDNSPASLVQAIEKIMDSDARQMGRKGRSWMESEFTWENLARQMNECYQQVLTKP